MTAGRLILAVHVALCGACSGPAASAGDGGPLVADGGYQPPRCQVETGRTYIFQTVEILPFGEGVDITGDGEPDNLLGKIAPLANPTIDNALEGGTGNFLLDFTDWSDPPTANDPDITETFYLGVDADSPPDPSNNRTGDGEFWVVDRQFDVNCQPLSRQDGRIEDGVAYSNPAKWRLLIEGAGTVVYVDLHLTVDFTDDTFTEFDGGFGAGWSTCNMHRASGPLFAGGDMLSTTVNNVHETTPDLDLDGDGLEQFVGDGTKVVACIDGDGTRIDDPDCPCDPRIADAYSVSVRIHGVPAKIRGVLHSP